MSIYYGKRGKLLIYDSTKGRDLSQTGPKEVHISNANPTHTDITADMLNPSSGTNTILNTNTDHVYVGQLFRFSKVDIDLTVFASADGGALVVEYWDGTAWASVAELIDGTAVGGNTMQSDGKVQFREPSNWVTNDPPTTGTNLFYIRFRTTVSVGTDPIAQLIEPSSGQHMEVAFVNMDLNGPEGPPRPEDIFRTDRGQLTSSAGYIQGPDDPALAPMNMTFSATIDDLVNRTALSDALACNNAGLTNTWPKVGISTKTDSQRRAGLSGNFFATAPFDDPVKKTVCVQVEYEQTAGNSYREYNEVYFDPVNISLNEAVDGVNLSMSGMIYGDVRTDLQRLGYRF
jgi:hypothetical protein